VRALVVGTAGHIDHGKSALVEALTGTHPDRLTEEQARGITIDLGFAHFTHGDAAVALVDVPGHERFVRNMLAGAGGIDAVLLVVAADESVMPQTREHFDICRLLGVERGLVALTKCDLVDADTLNLVRLEVRDAVAGSFLDGAPVLAVSARSGAGLDALRDALASLAGPAPRLGRAGLTRLPVDRVFSVRGFGTVVTGTLVSGRVAEGDELDALPDGRRVRVRGVQVHGRPAAEVVAPRRVALNLGSIERGELARGATLATPGSLPVTRRVDARIELLASARALGHGARVRLHHGTSEVIARVTMAAVRDRPEGAWIGAEPGRAGVAVQPGGEGLVRIRLERPAVLTRGDRVVLRAYSPAATIGGGVVLDPEPPPGRLRRSATLARFARLEQAEGALRTWLSESGLRGLTEADLVRRGGQSPEGAAAMMESARGAGWATRIDERVFEKALVERVEADLVRALEAYHRAQPHAPGCPREELRHRVAAGAPTGLFAAVVDGLAAKGRIAGVDRLRLSTHDPESAAGRSEAIASILDALEHAGLTPPDPAGLAEAAGLSEAEVRDVLAGLVRDRRLVRLDTLVFHPRPLDELKGVIRGLGSGAAVDVAFVKSHCGVTRKFAIPLLEWLDRERVTRRTGDRRVVL
jgi:selenocysteine-specific elongation factor